MLFNSYVFIFIFLPLTILVFYQIGRLKNPNYGITWLIISSLFFYAWWSPKFLLLIIFSIGANFYLGKKLILSSQKKILYLGLAINLFLICLFKYADFLIENLSYIISTPLPLPHFALPLAISFFTFQQIAFLVDCYKGKIQTSHFLKYSLFIVFFPQLIAGPIVQHQQFIPQVEKKYFTSLKSKNIAIGLAVFIIGLFKKIVIADNLALFANPIFKAAELNISLSFFEAWWGAISYTIQLYFDFSGYSDMAIGLALLFNIQLPINFNSPYKALNIIDFWRRWHITLSSFLRDYLYIALGGNKKGTWRRHMNLMITMLLGGLWHGANWNFIIWGGLHGLYLIINHTWRKFRAEWLHHDLTKQHFIGQKLSQLLTLVCVIIAWVFFRAETLHGAKQILKAMFGMNGISLLQSLKYKIGPLGDWMILHGVQFEGLFINELADLQRATYMFIIAWLIILVMPNTQQIMLNKYHSNIFHNIQHNEKSLMLSWKRNLRWGIIIGMLGMIAILNLSKASDFIYYQF